MVDVNQSAPDFSLQATGNRTISLGEFRGKKNLVLFFYPQDWTPV